MLKNIFSIFFISFLIFINLNKKEVIEIKNNFNNLDSYNKYDYFMKIEIDKININRYIYNDSRNNIEENITYHELSSMPNVLNGNLILMAHSGDSVISYFNKLYLLDKNDVVYIYYNNYKYTYIVENKYEVEKTGMIDIKRKNKNTLTLITCIGLDKQLVVISYLKDKTLI